MDPKCYLCGYRRTRHDTTEQVTHITKRVEELAMLRKGNGDLRSCIEKHMPTESDLLAEQKAKYIQLLHKKEMLLHRVHKVKESVRYGEEDLIVLSENLQQLRSSNLARKNALEVTSSVNNSLEEDLKDRTIVLRAHRWNCALAVFKMMKIDAEPPERSLRGNDDEDNTTAKPVEMPVAGCSSILSIPLPNCGDYSGTPLDVVTTALAHIAHLVDALSATLNIPLPHPLLPFQASECMVSAQHDLWARAQVPNCCYSLCPAKHLTHNQAGFKEFDWASLNTLSAGQAVTVSRKEHSFHTPSSSSTPSSHTVVANAIVHGEMRQYAMNSTFSAALVLLQADIVALCVRAGLSAEALFPAEAMLWNLHLLQQHCTQAVRQASNTILSSIQEVPLIHASGEDDVRVQHWLREQTLRSISDRYGSQATVEALDSTERVCVVGEGGKYVRADFTPERSGLPREEEWDIVHTA